MGIVKDGSRAHTARYLARPDAPDRHIPRRRRAAGTNNRAVGCARCRSNRGRRHEGHESTRYSGSGHRGIPRVSRRRVLGGMGAGGLATAATVFGFASPASATTVPYGCCHLCCKPSGHTLAQCESGFHYVWTCTESSGTRCTCCEHRSPCHNGCNSTHYSGGRCA